MTEFFQTSAVFLWLALAVLCAFIGKKYGAAGYLMAAMFLFMTVWYGLRAFGGLPVFDGAFMLVFRGILLVFLAAIVFVWYRGKKRRPEDEALNALHAQNCDCAQCQKEKENT
jgi:hypothetical protein